MSMHDQSNKGSAVISNAIIGGGCAGYSLARHAAKMDGVSVLLAGDQRRQDHSWGFFLNEDTKDAADILRKTWHRWQVITRERHVTQEAKTYPYAGLESKAWLSKCKAEAEHIQVSRANVLKVEGGAITTDQGVIVSKTIYDSRPPLIPPRDDDPELYRT